MFPISRCSKCSWQNGSRLNSIPEQVQVMEGRSTLFCTDPYTEGALTRGMNNGQLSWIADVIWGIADRVPRDVCVRARRWDEIPSSTAGASQLGAVSWGAGL